jgi:GNAT superfamily N-acetyltransferase
VTQGVTIRAARVEEAAFLSDLALRSKAHWGYDDAFIEACRDELSLDASRLDDASFQCFVAEGRGATVGFYSLLRLADEDCELEALFVEPASIGTGVGRALIQHAIGQATVLGCSRLIIQGDPNASGFYVAAGGRQIGSRESGSIAGRYLPVFEIGLDPD